MRCKEAEALQVVETPSIKLDFGCGQHKREGFEGVDRLAFDGVDHVVDLTKAPYPWADGSVQEAHASHFVEHLTPLERNLFVNELHRILVPGGQCLIITPYWCSNRAYGDCTHQWPPISEMWFFYLNQDWRKSQAPHTDAEHMPGGLSCDFDFTCGYSFHPQLTVRNHEFQQFAVTFYKEAAQDLIATLTKIVRK